MGVKASSTINSRGMVVKRFQFWCTTHNRPAWPMKEQVAFDYVSHLKSLKSLGAARAQSSFLQAINFMIYAIEPDGAQTVIESYMIQGVAKQSASSKRALKQAPALSVNMVLRLRAILGNEQENLFDRLAAGLMLMCVYGRCRCSDLRFVQEISLDVSETHGFIEAKTEFHKTANREKRRLLPRVAPAFGVTDENWAEQFLSLRQEALGKFIPSSSLATAVKRQSWPGWPDSGQTNPLWISCHPQFHLYIDGACEWEVARLHPRCGLGAVLIGPGVAYTWGLQVAAQTSARWALRAQLVFECELLPYLLSLQLWARALEGCDLFVDAVCMGVGKAFECLLRGVDESFALPSDQWSVSFCFSDCPKIGPELTPTDR